MSHSLQHLEAYLREKLADKITATSLEYGELTIDIKGQDILPVSYFMVSDEQLACDQLIDISGVDYLAFGNAEWSTKGSGFSRGVEPAGAEWFRFEDEEEQPDFEGERFAVIYHLLSVVNNHRIRIRAYCEDNDFPQLDSVVEVWSSANWFEREAFDLYGIIFVGHPDLRRILTDYGFVGHPFRKDFPLVGNVEMRYDEKQQRVLYQPVSIDPRVLVPRVIRDNDSVMPPLEGDD